MKTAVVYYSLDGSSREAAKQIAQRLGADVYELEEVKKRSGKPMSFMAAAMGALFGKRSRLIANPADKMNSYEQIYIGSPIWASRTVPAINTFISKLSASGKQIVFFTLQADPSPTPSKGLQKLSERLNKRGARVNRVIQLHGAKPGESAPEQHIQKQLEQLL